MDVEDYATKAQEAKRCSENKMTLPTRDEAIVLCFFLNMQSTNKKANDKVIQILTAYSNGDLAEATSEEEICKILYPLAERVHNITHRYMKRKISAIDCKNMHVDEIHRTVKALVGKVGK